MHCILNGWISICLFDRLIPLNPPNRYLPTKDALLQSMAICDRWIKDCDRLSTVMWVREPEHPWKGKGVKPDILVDLFRRLREINRVRNIHHILTCRLSREEQRSLNLEQVDSEFLSVGDDIEFSFSLSRFHFLSKNRWTHSNQSKWHTADFNMGVYGWN